MQEGGYKKITKARQYSKADKTDDEADYQLNAKGMTNAFHVTSTVKLSGEDTRARSCAEYGKVKYENKLVYDSETRHLLGTERADHKVVKQVDKVSDGVLYYHWYSYSESALVKRLVADVALQNAFIFY